MVVPMKLARTTLRTVRVSEGMLQDTRRGWVLAPGRLSLIETAAGTEGMFRPLAAAVVMVMATGTAVRATLVVGVTTSRGWVVCADKRLYDAGRGVIDSETKVYSFDQNTLFTSIGGYRFYELDKLADGQVALLADTVDSNTVVREYARTRRFSDTDEFWDALGERLVDALQAVFVREPHLHRNSSDDFVTVFFWNEPDGSQKRRLLTVKFVRRPEVTYSLD